MSDPSEENSYVAGSIFSELFGRPSRAKILDVFLGKPDIELSIAEIADFAAVDRSTVSRNLDYLIALGLIEETRKAGNAQLYQLNHGHPISDNLANFHDELMYNVEAVRDLKGDTDSPSSDDLNRQKIERKINQINDVYNHLKKQRTASEYTIVIVEDEPEVAEVYHSWLSSEYDAIVTNDGENALETIDERVDLVFLDRRLPKISGDEVAEKLREKGFAGPICMLTAVEPDVDIFDLPVDDYMVKPVIRRDLTETAEYLLTISGYSEPERELFSLTSKLSAYKKSNSDEELAKNTKYQDLLHRFDNISKEVEEFPEP